MKKLKWRWRSESNGKGSLHKSSIQYIVEIVGIFTLLVCIYLLGYGQGQLSTYNKINDDRSLDDVYKVEVEIE